MASVITVEKKVYTVAEVAKMLGCTIFLVYDQLAEGKIPGLKIGGKWIVPIRRFEEWLNNGGNTEKGGDG